MAAPPATDVIIEVPEEAARKLARNEPHTFSNMSSDTPLLRVGGKLYAGTVERIVGTHLLFDAARKRSAGYVGAATAKIVFEARDVAQGKRSAKRKRREAGGARAADPATAADAAAAPEKERDGRQDSAGKDEEIVPVRKNTGRKAARADMKMSDASDVEATDST